MLLLIHWRALLRERAALRPPPPMPAATDLIPVPFKELS
jgi:hypothetical protein